MLHVEVIPDVLAIPPLNELETTIKEMDTNAYICDNSIIYTFTMCEGELIQGQYPETISTSELVGRTGDRDCLWGLES
jgi:hypothetical protein